MYLEFTRSEEGRCSITAVSKGSLPLGPIRMPHKLDPVRGHQDLWRSSTSEGYDWSIAESNTLCLQLDCVRILQLVEGPTLRIILSGTWPVLVEHVTLMERTAISPPAAGVAEVVLAQLHD